MALKFRLTKAQYDKLSDEIKGEYKENDGSYELDVEGIEDTSALRRARDREKAKREEIEQELADARSNIDTLTEENTSLKAKKTGKDTDIERLEGQWKKKVEDAQTDRDTKIAAKDATIKKLMIDTAAAGLASQISNSPKIMQKHLMDRLTVDFDGDEPALTVLDNDGKPSRMSLEDLGKEFVANKDYSAIILGSKARGSVTPSNTSQNPGAGGNLGSSQETPDFSKMPAKDLAAHLKASKEAAE